MNKYHKYRSKSGTLPGWIRIGALALGAGVGAGDWTQGGQTQYAKAGDYHVSVRKSDAGVAVYFEDVETGQTDKVSFTPPDGTNGMFHGFTVPQGSVTGEYKYSKDRFLFSLGGFSFVLTPRCSLYVSGGSSEDSLTIEGGKVFVESLHEVAASVLALSGCEKVENYGKVVASIFSIDGCKSFVNAYLFAGLFVLSDVQIRNTLIEADEIVKQDMDDSVIDPFQEDRPCDLLRKKSGKRFVLKGFSDEFGGCFRKHGYAEDWWSPYGDVSLPFCDSEHIKAQKMVVAGKEGQYYRFPKAGVYRCVLFLSVIDGCGALHEQDALVTIKNCKQGVLAKCGKCICKSYDGKKPLPFPCIMKLGDEDLFVAFFVKAQCKAAGGTSLIRTDSVVYFQLVEDSSK